MCHYYIDANEKPNQRKTGISLGEIRTNINCFLIEYHRLHNYLSGGLSCGILLILLLTRLIRQQYIWNIGESGLKYP